jgi:hypothetical protein
MFYLSTYKKPAAKKVLKRASKGEIPTMQETTDLAADVLRTTSKALEDSLPEDCGTKKAES